MNNKNPTRHVFKYKHTKWSRWCITVSLNYKNTMINRITMETVAWLRSKCHLKQNIIPSWPWPLRHTSCISDFRCKTKCTNTKIFDWHPDRHTCTWQYCRSLWFSARLVRRISKSLVLCKTYLTLFLIKPRIHSFSFLQIITQENSNEQTNLF